MSGATQIGSLEELIEAMAQAISPYAFGKGGCETERDFSRAAATRAMRVCAPIVLAEVERMLWAPDEESLKRVSIIESLKEFFK